MKKRQVKTVIANFHTHTRRCRHAVGTEDEYVQAALEAGLKILGFSDHTPYYFPGNYYSTFRMYPSELKGYVDSVLRVRKAYEGQIRIPLGLEAEFYPGLFPELLPRLQDAGIEYLLLGQHFVGDEVGEHYCGRPTADPDVLRRYCRQVCDAMDTGLFSYLAHPDLLFFTGSPALYREQMREVCKAAKACGVPLEVNLLGIFSGRHYPNPVFWELAAEENCPVVIGRDAHAPMQLLDGESLNKAQQMIEKLGLQVQETVRLRRI